MNNYYPEPRTSSAAIPTPVPDPVDTKATVKSLVCSTNNALVETNDQLRAILDSLGGILDNRPSQSERNKSSIMEDLFDNDTLAVDNLKLVAAIRNCLG